MEAQGQAAQEAQHEALEAQRGAAEAQREARDAQQEARAAQEAVASAQQDALQAQEGALGAQLLARESQLLAREAQLVAREAILEDRARKQARYDQFLAMLGHELRNPLAPILTALDIMKRKGVGADRELAVIERQVRALVRIVDDLVEVTRGTQGKIPLRKAPIELASVIAAAVEVVSPLFAKRSQQLSIDAPAGLRLEGDSQRLVQVLVNVLTNAAKFTDSGGHAAIACTREGRELVVRVRDDGIGLAPGLLAHVFEPFVQGPQALDRAQGGFGLGLTLAKSLIELHGGTIAVRSEGTGKGTEVILRLPALDGPEEVPVPAPPPPAVSAAQTGRRILVVDDNADSAAMLGDALRLSGYEVAVAHDPHQALALAEAQPFDVAFLDIGLPEMDGCELARRLRAIWPDRPVQLVAITGYGRDSDRQRTRDAGFAAHLTKPFELDDVLRWAAPAGPERDRARGADEAP